MKKAFYIINYTYFICLGFLLAFAGIFSLGSKENLYAQLSQHFWKFIFARIIFNEAILLVFLLFLFLANFLFSSSVGFKVRFRLVLGAFLWLSLLSTAFIFLYYS